MFLFKWSSKMGKMNLEWQKSDPWLPKGGKGSRRLAAKGHEGTSGVMEMFFILTGGSGDSLQNLLKYTLQMYILLHVKLYRNSFIYLFIYSFNLMAALNGMWNFWGQILNLNLPETRDTAVRLLNHCAILGIQLSLFWQGNPKLCIRQNNSYPLPKMSKLFSS